MQKVSTHVLLEARSQLGTILEHLADSLDIPRELRDVVVDKYGDIANYLAAKDSPLLSADPDLYPQGSFSIDTVVRPVNEEAVACRSDPLPDEHRRYPG